LLDRQNAEFTEKRNPRPRYNTDAGAPSGSGEEVGGGKGYELAGSDDFGLFPEWGEVARVAGDQVVGAGGVGAFEEDVVVGVGGGLYAAGWRDQVGAVVE